MEKELVLQYAKEGFASLQYEARSGHWIYQTYNSETKHWHEHVLPRNKIIFCDIIFDDDSKLEEITLFRDIHNDVVIIMHGGRFLLTMDYGGSVLIKEKPILKELTNA